MGLILQPGTKDLEKRKKNKRRLLISTAVGATLLCACWILNVLGDSPSLLSKILLGVSIVWVVVTYFAFRVVWNPKVK